MHSHPRLALPLELHSHLDWVEVGDEQTSPVVSTQCFKYKAKRSSSVDTGSSSVDTRDSSQKTFWPIWDSVSTLDQVVSTLEAFPEHLLD
ncbi:hypothetical protein Taro_001806 [Colocasia esculenta]|uniref:Uncharacterized protein n=1 Tax=Colocasia esculenta TaxID=4460 RepID=A0A843TLW5_COLES|nr:hypothetical protein [Colocasia esculenta]